MSDNVLINANNISKKFTKTIKRMMLYGAFDLTRDLVGINTKTHKLRKGEFWALDDVSFELQKAETLGLVGFNGSGKSTLLKILNGIYMPDRGSATIRGRVGALIDVGAGFHPLLTGRENIYVNGQILGMSKREIDQKLDSIIDFAEISEFIDSPVKHYSSGMYVRLGFAVAIHSTPDILLVDEVLSVGDIHFREKSIERIISLKKSGTAIIFVSHSLYQIEALCEKSIWLNQGKLMVFGATRDTLSAYINYNEKLKLFDNDSRVQARSKAGLIEIKRVYLVDENGNEIDEVPFMNDIRIRVHFNAIRRIENPRFNICLQLEGMNVLEAAMLIGGGVTNFIEGVGTIDCIIKSPRLLPRVYNVLLWVTHIYGIGTLHELRVASKIKISDKNLDKYIKIDGHMGYTMLRQSGHVYAESRWENLIMSK